MAKVEINTKTEVAVLKKEMQMFQEANDLAHADIKKEVCDIKSDIKSLSADVKAALNNKADRDEVAEVKTNIKALWGLIVAVLSLVVGYMIYINQAFLQHLNK